MPVIRVNVGPVNALSSNGYNFMLKYLLQLLFQIMTFRQGPADVPYSRTLLWLMFVGEMLVEVLILLLPLEGEKPIPTDKFIYLILMERVFILGSIVMMMRIMNLTARIVQTMTALLGVNLVYGVILLFSYVTAYGLLGNINLLFIMNLGLLIWALMVEAHIFRLALNIPRVLAGFLVFAYFMMGLLIKQSLGLLGN